MRRLRLGTIHADQVTFDGALDAIAGLVAAGRGGYILTPNVDHLVLAEHSPELRAAYSDAALSLVDGMPLVWLSWLVGARFPEKVSGSDLAWPLLSRAAGAGWRVCFFGAAPGVGARAADILRAQLPALQVVGIDSPPLGFDQSAVDVEAALQRVRACRPDLVLFALGCPLQELLMHRWARALSPAVAIGVGGTLDFIAGEQKRAPAWMSRWGLEWLYRLWRQPRRMAQRYLVRDRAIFGIVWRMFRARRGSLLVDVVEPASLSS